jgi:hypothetical protein
MSKSVATQKKTVMASLRVLRRSLIAVVLTQAKAAHTFIDLERETVDGARQQREIRSAANVISLIDDILITLDATREQRAEIKKARNDLAERVKNLDPSVSL